MRNIHADIYRTALYKEIQCKPHMQFPRNHIKKTETGEINLNNKHLTQYIINLSFQPVINIILKCFTLLFFLTKVFKIWCVLYSYSTSQFKRAT